MEYLKDKPINFITWICPLLKPLVKMSDQFIYYEGDAISAIYFHQTGTTGFVLPRHKNLMYVNINKGHQFGVQCIIGSFLDAKKFEIDNWIESKDKLERMFTVQCKEQCELMTLSIHDVDMMKNQFYEAYSELFADSMNHLKRTFKVKIKAIKYYKRYH